MKRAATMRDIAQEVGVSKATVSLALSGKGNISPEMRRRIGDVARRLNHEPNLHAQRLNQGGSNFIGLFSVTVYAGVQTQIVESIQARLTAQGYDAPLYGQGFHEHYSPERQAEIINSLCRQQPRAIICNTGRLEEAALERLNAYVEQGGVLICYDIPTALPCDHVLLDLESMAHLSARHLLDMGHREIGFYCPLPSGNTVEYRFDGFRRALREAGLAVREEWIWAGPTFEAAGAFLAEKFLAAKSRPTGLAIVGDAAANVFMNQLHRSGVEVPRDLSVVSHHGFPVAEYSIPPLTTVAYPIFEMAERVVEFLLGRLNGEYAGEPRRIAVGGQLVQRLSVRPLS